MKIGALLRVAVDQICSAGRRPLAYLDGCPCSASPVSAAGSGSATQPTTAPYFVHRTRSPPLPRRGSEHKLLLLPKGRGGFFAARNCCAFDLSPKPPGLRCPVFLWRAAERPCENWSAAPGCRCPNMQRGTQPACIFGRLPLLRLACFCRRQRLGSAANHASLLHPLDAVAAAAPAPPRCICRRQRSAQLPPFGGTGR